VTHQWLNGVKKYYLCEIYGSLAEVEKAISEEGIYRYKITTKPDKNGNKKTFYSCNRTLTRGPRSKCSTGLYINMPSNNLKFEV
jgi:hypothetical protein